MIERDLETRPYTADELRVVGYLRYIVPDLGAGNDPIGFLIASHHHIVMERKSGVEGAFPVAIVSKQPKVDVREVVCEHDMKCTWFGAHPQYTCTKCGYREDYDYTSGEVLQRTPAPPPISRYFTLTTGAISDFAKGGATVFKNGAELSPDSSEAERTFDIGDIVQVKVNWR